MTPALAARKIQLLEKQSNTKSVVIQRDKSLFDPSLCSGIRSSAKPGFIFCILCGLGD